MSPFERFLEEIKQGAVAIAKKEAAGLVKDVTDDAAAFLQDIDADLQTWVEQLISGKLQLADFTFLIQGKKDLARMHALTQAGLAAIRIDRIRSALIDLIITAAGKMIPK